MKILIDMNLSPKWCDILARHGWESVLWASVGKPTAPDRTILEYARDNGYIILTHDLDFSAVLATTGASAPSVIQVRTQDILSERFQILLVGALRQFESALTAGALVIVNESQSKARILPLH